MRLTKSLSHSILLLVVLLLNACYTHRNEMSDKIAYYAELERKVIVDDSVRKIAIKLIRLDTIIYVPWVYKGAYLVVYVSKDELRNVFSQFSRFQNLKEIEMHDEPIDSIPGTLCMLSMIERLTFINMNLSTLPLNISELKNLKYLDMDFDKNLDLHQIFNVLKDCDSLKHLSLYNCAIIDLPDEISNLQSLQYLWLGNNQIKALPESIQYLNNLRTLCIPDNQIQSIPQFLDSMKSLKFVSFSGNPINESEKKQLLAHPPHYSIEW